MARARRFVLFMRRLHLAGDGYGNYLLHRSTISNRVEIEAGTLLEAVRIACRVANADLRHEQTPEGQVDERYWRIRSSIGKLGTDFGNGWLVWRGK